MPKPRGPALQTIPLRTVEGALVRRAVADRVYVNFVNTDFSQLEPRVLAGSISIKED